MDFETPVCPTCTAEVAGETRFCAVCGTGLKRPEWGWRDFVTAGRLVGGHAGRIAVLSLLLVGLLVGLGLAGNQLFVVLLAVMGWTPTQGRALIFVWILAALFHVPLAGVSSALLTGARTGRMTWGHWAAVWRGGWPILWTSGLVLGLWLAVGLGVTRLVAAQGWPAGWSWLIPAGWWFVSAVVGITYLHLALLEILDRGSRGRLALRRAGATLRGGSWPLLLTVGLALVVGFLGVGGFGVGVLLTGPLALSLLVLAHLRLSPVTAADPPAVILLKPRRRLPLAAWAGLGLVAVILTGGVTYYFARVPWRSATYRRGGDRLVAAGEPAKAVPYYREWARLQPRNAAAHSALAQVLAAAQRWPEAITEQQAALKLSASVEGHLALADLQYNHGDREQALAHYEAALRLDPNNADAHLALADMRYERGELEAAAAAYEKALALAPENATAFHNLGEIRDKLGRTDQAIKAYREAARLGSEYLETYTALATLLKKRGQWGQAVESYEAAVRLQPQNENLLNLLQEARDHAAWTVLGTGPMTGLELTLLSTQVNAVAGKAQGASGASMFEGVFLFVEVRLRNVTDQPLPKVTWPDGSVWLQVGNKKILPTLLYTGDKMVRLNDPHKSWAAPVTGPLPPSVSRTRALLFPGRQFPTGATQGVFQGNYFGPIKVGWEG